MKNELLTKGIILPSGEIGKNMSTRDRDKERDRYRDRKRERVKTGTSRPRSLRQI